MIVNVRGTNGSGKSTLVRGIRDLGPWEEVHVPYRKKPIGYITPGIQTGVAGVYKTQCGGCDSISTQQEVRDYVRVLADHSKNVVFEGVLLCTIFNPWITFSRENEDKYGRTVWAFLDTPYEVCLERIYKRNGGKKIKEDGVRSKYEANLKFRDRAAQFGERVEVIPYQNALLHLRSILGV